MNRFLQRQPKEIYAERGYENNRYKWKCQGKKGVTWKILDRFLRGIEESGTQVYSIQLKDLTISYCTACLTCMHKTPGKCAIKDDMDKIYPHLKVSDILVIATPVYVDNMSAQMKAVMDRCICCLEPFLRIDAADRVRHPFSWTMPKRFFLFRHQDFRNLKAFSLSLRPIRPRLLILAVNP